MTVASMARDRLRKTDCLDQGGLKACLLSFLRSTGDMGEQPYFPQAVSKIQKLPDRARQHAAGGTVSCREAQQCTWHEQHCVWADGSLTQ